MGDGGEVPSGISQGFDEEEGAENVCELYEEVDAGVVSGSNAEVVQGVVVEERKERIRQVHEDLSFVATGCQSALYSESLSSEISDSEDEGEVHSDSDSASDSESTSGFWRFVRAVFDCRYEYALAVFKPAFAAMRIVPNKHSLYRKYDVVFPSPLHWLMNCFPGKSKLHATRLKLVEAVSNSRA